MKHINPKFTALILILVIFFYIFISADITLRFRKVAGVGNMDRQQTIDAFFNE